VNQVIAEQLLIVAPLAWLGAAIAGRLKIQPFIGAVAMGIVLGPAVLGHWAPRLDRIMFQGKGSTVEQFDQAMDQRRQTRQALVDSGVSDAAVAEFDQQTLATIHRLERQAYRQQQQRIEARHSAVIGLGFIWLLLAGATVARSTPRKGWLDAVGVGAAVMVVGGAAVALAVVIFAGRLGAGGDGGPMSWRAVTGLLAIGMVAGSSVPIDGPMRLMMPGRAGLSLADTRRIARQLQVLLIIVPWLVLLSAIWWLDGRWKPVNAGLMLLAVCLVLNGRLARAWLGPIASGAVGALAVLGWIWVSFQSDLPLLLMGTGVGMGLMPLIGRSREGASAIRRPASLARSLISPVVCCLLAMRIEPVGDFHWLVFLIVLLLCGDIRWLGVVAGYRLINRSWRAGMAGATALVDAGPMLLLLSLTARQMNLIDSTIHVAVVLAVPILALMQPVLIRLLAEWGRWDEGLGLGLGPRA
jgi:Kef-type K+ transport system membrane component KefB